MLCGDVTVLLVEQIFMVAMSQALFQSQRAHLWVSVSLSVLCRDQLTPETVCDLQLERTGDTPGSLIRTQIDLVAACL